jgi:flagellar motor switch protein FliG
MALAGKRKAAALLMGLDTATASELLKGLPHEDIRQIALEMALIDISGHRDKKEETKIAREFCNSLRKNESRGFSVRKFLSETIANVLNKAEAEEIQAQIRKITEKEDPFELIRSANPDELVLAMEGEHPEAIAVVLSELDSKKIQEVLPLLDEKVSCRAVWKMAKPSQLKTGVKHRIASIVSKRLRSFEGETLVEKPKDTLRKVAIVLNDVEKNLRDRLLEEIGNHDEEAGVMIRNLMITWEDIPSIADRSLQTSLRTVEPGKLAIALYGADEEVVRKIRSNISERVAAAVDEEASLMQEPLEEEIFDAREVVVKPLREANEEGTLRRVKH